MSKLQEIVRKIKRVPLLSQTAMQLLSVVGDRNHTIADVVRVVERDPGLTASLLRIVNSAAFALPQPVSTLERAVPLLGDKIIAGIALSQSAGEVYGDPMEGYGGVPGALWSHSILTAAASRELAGFARTGVDPGLAYVAGLLHDIGKSVISEFLKDSVDDIVLALDQHETADYLEAEREALGTCHGEVGQVLAKHWKLPEPLPTVIRHHHQPAKAPEEHRGLCYLVHLGDFVAMMAGRGTGADTLQYVLDQGYEQYIVLSTTDLERVMLIILQELEDAKMQAMQKEFGS